MQIKESGWFAAGRGVRQALGLLSDGAFKLYVFLCLHAKRDTGSITISYAAVAKALDKSPRSINAYFKELRERGVCVVYPAVNQHSDNEIEICDEFWAYSKASWTEDKSDIATYIQKIRRLLSTRECVRCSFSGADQKLAASYFHRGITLEQIGQAIVMGCCRKYVSWLNGSESEPIVSFRYFMDIVEEVIDTPPSKDQIFHLEKRLSEFQLDWREKVRNNEDVRETRRQEDAIRLEIEKLRLE